MGRYLPPIFLSNPQIALRALEVFSSNLVERMKSEWIEDHLTDENIESDEEVKPGETL
jgi:hypothetical protein